MAIEETLPEFKSMVVRLLSMEISDPNIGVDMAGEALGLIHRYAADEIDWSAFLAEANRLIEEAQSA